MRAACVPTTPPPSTTTFAARTPGTPPMSTPRPPVGRRKAIAAASIDKTPRDLAHRREQRQAAVSVGHGLIGDRRRAGRHEPVGLLRIRSEMQIGEKDLMRLEPAILDRLRLLDLDDHLGLGEHVLRRRENAGARLLVGRVVGEDAGARAGLHHDLVPARHELANGARHEPNAELIALDLCRNADAHFFLRWKVFFPRFEACPKPRKDCWLSLRAKV